jgi:hypothetical protein
LISSFQLIGDISSSRSSGSPRSSGSSGFSSDKSLLVLSGVPYSFLWDLICWSKVEKTFCLVGLLTSWVLGDSSLFSLEFPFDSSISIAVSS